MIPLENIRVATPCKAEWRWMYGDERVRFCGQCKLNVYNLSAMTRREAEDLVRRTEGRLCVRFYRRKDGTILTENCPVGLRAVKKKLSGFSTAVITALLSFLINICGIAWLHRNSAADQVIMGGIGIPLEQPVDIPLRQAEVVMPEQDYIPPAEPAVSRSEAFIRRRATYKITPVYASDGPERRQESVSVKVTISEEGQVIDAGYYGCPTSSFIHVAIDAASKWKFKPTYVAGKPVRVESYLTFKFRFPTS